jgi:excisionase family DNA binding protein
MKNPRSSASKAAASGGDLLGMDEAIALLKTTRPTFYRWLKTGKLKGMKVGRQWRFYRNDVEGFLRGEGLRYDLPVGVEPLIAALRSRIGEKGASVSSLSDAEKLKLTAELIVRVGTVLKASDIHLDTVRDSGRLRYRVNGVLVVVAEFDAKLMPALIAAFKIMGKCEISVKNVPQDSRIKFRSGETDLDLLMNFLPSWGGETMNVRLLFTDIASVTLDALAAGNAVREELISALAAPSGIIVVSGPTVSGKTSLLYACVNHLATPERKVVAIEDPVEYPMPGVVQVSVNKGAGLTAANVLRAVMRSDPNVIVIGELNDPETADLACKAAMTGQLVLTTMHAKDTGHVITRLMDMGVAPRTLADSLRLVTSQRLVRKVCKECGTKDSPSDALLDWAKEAAAAGGAPRQSGERKYRKGAGCAKCGMSGFKGRSLVIESMKVGGDIAAAIREGDPGKARALAVKHGMRSQEADAVRQASEGVTSLAEARRAME